MRSSWGAALLWAGPALAQVPPEPFDSLLRPSPLSSPNALSGPNALTRPDALSSPNPLSTPDPLSQPDLLLQGGKTPCDRTTASRQDAGPSARRPGGRSAAPLAYGGTGPGEYGRFVPGLATPRLPTQPDTPGQPRRPEAPATPPLSTMAPTNPFGWGDRPLIAGTVPAGRGEAAPGADRGSAAPAFAYPMDRPLSGDRSTLGSPARPCTEPDQPTAGALRR